jgi:predicted TIM-barrel fold metal-dependent hydrolase
MGQPRAGGETTRRQLLAGLAAAALLPGGKASAQAANPGLVDVHHHYYPTEIIDGWQEYVSRHGEGALAPRMAQWSPDSSLREMDEGGVAVSMLSLASIPGVWFGCDTAEMRRLSRLCNEFAAEMVTDHPGRYGLFASLPLPDVEGSLKEIEYAFDTLRADGINLPTSFGDRWPGDPAYKPVFEELNRRKAIVFLHPYAPNCCAGLDTGISPGVLEFPYDTGRAIVSLLFSGTLARLRDIRWIFCHGGGVMPMVAGRVAYFAQARKDLQEIAPDGVLGELRRLYYDTANAAWPVSLTALLKMVPVSQVLFGTDFPYLTTPPQSQELDKAGLPPETLAAIRHGNAARLIPRLQA